LFPTFPIFFPSRGCLVYFISNCSLYSALSLLSLFIPSKASELDKLNALKVDFMRLINREVEQLPIWSLARLYHVRGIFRSPGQHNRALWPISKRNRV